MPFRSVKQRKYMWSKHPEVAKKWTAEHGSKIVSSTRKKPRARKKKK